jgi:hypothetical protein
MIEWFRSFTAVPVSSGPASLIHVRHTYVGIISEEFIRLSTICLNWIQESFP